MRFRFVDARRAGAGTALALAGIVALGGSGASAASALEMSTLGEGAEGSTVTIQLAAPQPVSYTRVETSISHAVALGSDGSAYAWGSNDQGQLGTGDTNSSAVPVRVAIPRDVTLTDIAVGTDFSLALSSTGEVFAWGSNEFAQLGGDDRSSRSTPERVPFEGVAVTDVEAGDSTAYALDGAHGLYAWGSGEQGQLGIGQSGSGVAVPAPTRVQGEYQAVSAGTSHAVALMTDGGLVEFGALGVGGNADAPVAVAAPEGVGFSTVAAANDTSYAVATDGAVYAWGHGASGALGNGANDDSAAAVRVALPEGVSIKSVSGHYGYAMALGVDGQLYAWGQNGGRFGDGRTDSNTPVLHSLSLPDGVTLVAVSGAVVTSALGSDGQIYSWGATPELFGNGATEPSIVPVVAQNPPAAVLGLSSVQFGGRAADPESFVEVSPGVWTIVVPAPPKNGGSVDVVVNWTQDGVAQEPIHYRNGFTYKSGDDERQECGTGSGQPFVDVAAERKFAAEIDWMYWCGISTGIKKDGKRYYEPLSHVTREAMAAFLYRAEGADFKAPKTSPFADVKPGDKFYDQIAWMHAEGISTGVKQASGKPRFNPKDSISREAMAAFMYRLEGAKTGAPQQSPFPDVKPGDPFAKEIAWMHAQGLSTGVKQSSGKPHYKPKGSVTREAMAAFLYRVNTDQA